jgi:hypothetical protein
LALSDDDPAPGEPVTLDSFLQLIVPSTGTFFIAVSSSADVDFNGGEDALTSGPYTLSVACSPVLPPPEPGALLGATGNQGQALIDIDPTTGTGTFRAPQGAFGPVTEIEFRDDGTLFGSTGGGTSNIITIDPATGEETLVGMHTLGMVNGLEFVGSTLYGTFVPSPDEPSELVTVDQTTGALTFIGPTGFSNIGGRTFDASSRTMYGVARSDLITIDLETGEGTLVGPTDFSNVSALEFGPDGTLYGGIGGASSDAGSLISIDPATGAGMLIGPTDFPSLDGLAFVPSAALCTLNLTASFIDGFLTLEFDLGTQEPATWNVWLTSQSEIINLVSAPLSMIDPPIPVHLTLPFFPSLGTIGILTTLTTPEAGIICSEFVLVDTGPSFATLAVARQALQEPFMKLTGALGQRLQLHNVQ